MAQLNCIALLLGSILVSSCAAGGTSAKENNAMNGSDRTEPASKVSSPDSKTINISIVGGQN